MLNTARSLIVKPPIRNLSVTAIKSNEVCPVQVDLGVKREPESPFYDRTAWENAKPYEDMPGPRPIPILGNTWRFLPKIGDFSQTVKNVMFLFTKLHKDHGDIVRLNKVAGRKNGVFLFQPEDIETIYKLEGFMPERDILGSMSYFRANKRQDIFANARGLLTSQGEEWYSFRNKVNSIMMQPKIVKHYIEPIDEIAGELTKKIQRSRTDKNKLNGDIVKVLHRWSLQTIAFVALDTKLNCLDDNLPEDSLPVRLIELIEDIFTIGGKLDFEPSVWRLVSTPTFRRGMKLYDDLVTLEKILIEEAKERIEKNNKNRVTSDAEPSVLEKLLKIDKNVAIVMALDMMMAGVDTTSNSLVNVLYRLASNPAKQEKLREEIFHVVPPSTKLTSEHLNSMPYLKAVIKESARLFPITPGTMRILTKDTVLRGYRLPKGVEVFFPHMYLSVQEDRYRDATKFIPERWLRDNVDSEYSYKNAHPFCTMHFGFGSRACIGKRFAELELEVAVVNIFKNLKLTWSGPPPPVYTTSINYLKGPFDFTFEDLN